MNTTHTYFRPTTAQQRRLLFETWEATGSVAEACRKARVSRATFYYWKPRFDEGGYGGLEQTESHAPKSPNKTVEDIEKQVIDMHHEHPAWGKQRMADELAKDNNWTPVISPNTVRRILEDANLWSKPEVETPQESFDEPAVRTADKPGQTVNVDLCFVPVTHQTEDKIPAVSGSSGRLVVERTGDEKGERQYPGRVFEAQERDYAEVMTEFVAVSSNSEPKKPEVENPDSIKAQKQALSQEEKQLRDERQTVREQRKREDAAWKQLKVERKEQQEKQAELTGQQRRQQDEQWRTLRQQHQQTLEKRKQEDEQWRQKRLGLRQRQSLLPLVIAWIAVLVIVDNCSRQCLGLPLFVAGPRVTAEMVVAALRDLLPPELQFLISDRGVHFTAKVFQEFARTQEFLHVLTARHRPQSNGIAERFVRTLKEWLRDKSWQNDQELAELLAEFLTEYSDRPHQGIDGP